MKHLILFLVIGFLQSSIFGQLNPRTKTDWIFHISALGVEPIFVLSSSSDEHPIAGSMYVGKFGAFYVPIRIGVSTTVIDWAADNAWVTSTGTQVILKRYLPISLRLLIYSSANELLDPPLRLGDFKGTHLAWLHFDIQTLSSSGEASASLLDMGISWSPGAWGELSLGYRTVEISGVDILNTSVQSVYLKISLQLLGTWLRNLKPVYTLRLQENSNFEDLKLGNGNETLQPGERAEIVANMSNSGQGESKGLVLYLRCPDPDFANSIVFPSSYKVGDLEAGAIKEIRIPITAKEGLPSGSFKFEVSGKDDDGNEVEPTSISITSLQLIPPYLQATARVIDENEDNILSAGENVKVLVGVKNSGRGTAHKVRILLSSKDSDLNSVTIDKEIGTLISGETKDEMLAFRVPIGIKSGKKNLTVKVFEASGYNAEEVTIPLEAKALLPAEFQIATRVDDDAVGNSQGNGNGIIEKTEVIELHVQAKNVGRGEARGVKLNLNTQETGITIIAGSANLGNIPPNKSTTGTLVLGVSAQYPRDRLLLELEITEETGLFGAKKIESFPVKERTIVITPQSVPQTPQLEGLSSVDVPRSTNMRNRDAIAVIIGNSRYENQDLYPVEFAENDARVVRNYLLKTFGYSEANIITEMNADKATFEKIFGTKEDFRVQLFNRVRKGKSDVFIYFSGHGVPDLGAREAYLATRNSDPAYIRVTGYSLQLLFDNLTKIALEKEIKNVTVVIDACFSGVGEKGPLIANVSPVSITIQNPLVHIPNSTIITSSASGQVSGWFREQSHGLFTYFFLKGLQGDADLNKDKVLTVEELEKYLTDETDGVPHWSRYLNSREQTPQVIGKDKQRVLVKY